jgi:hypothetical protein
MSRFGSFVLGLVIGAAAVFVSLKYHVVQAADGFHLIPKLSAEFSETYVDIRQFSFADWDQHRTLAVAILRADKAYLMQNQASESLMRSVNGFLQTLTDQSAGEGRPPADP